MPVSPLILELLEQAAESGLSAEEVCKDRPHLLEEVRACLRQLSPVRDELDALFPDDDEPAPSRPSGARPEIPGYGVGDVIGRGGMGVVYKAVQLRLKRPVAVKMMLNGGYAGPPNSRGSSRRPRPSPRSSTRTSSRSTTWGNAAASPTSRWSSSGAGTSPRSWEGSRIPPGMPPP